MRAASSYILLERLAHAVACFATSNLAFRIIHLILCSLLDTLPFLFLNFLGDCVNQGLKTTYKILRAGSGAQVAKGNTVTVSESVPARL